MGGLLVFRSGHWYDKPSRHSFSFWDATMLYVFQDTNSANDVRGGQSAQSAAVIELTFDPNYNYAPMQRQRVLLGLRYTLR